MKKATKIARYKEALNTIILAVAIFGMLISLVITRIIEHITELVVEARYKL